MKGIILAGGRGTRLYPMTKAMSKQLLPVYDKPMVYYPLSILLLAGIKEILIISTPEDIEKYEELLGDGKRLGVRFEYKIQSEPRGLADAFILGEEFIGKDNVCLILGDNIFYGQDFASLLKKARTKIENNGGALIYGYPVKDAREFGVLELGEGDKVLSIEEKPKYPKSNYAVPGLYFYDNSVIEVAKNVKPSQRGEIEITAVNNAYLEKGLLNAVLMGRGMAWLDSGTPQGLLKAAEYVEAIQERQGFYISCIEEIAWRKGYISDEELRQLGDELSSTSYGDYIKSLVDGNIN